MKKTISLFIALLATISLWASNVITYTASSKLKETTSTHSSGLHTNAFNVSITSHTFSNGTGTITFSGEVTSIGYEAFFASSGLTSITIPNSVTSIGVDAFYNCSGLTSITIPNSVTSIGRTAFEGCSGLTSITIPNGVTSIGGGAFSGCSGLTSITIPNSVTSIGESAFKGCSGLTSITIPNSVTSIGKSAFSGCSGLTTIVWNAQSFPSPSSSSGSPFYDVRSQITGFVIGDSVQSIPAYLCYDMPNLTSVTIGNSVTSIGKSAFSGCSGLTTIVWNAQSFPSPSSSSGSPFYDVRSQITGFVIGEDVQSVPDYLCYSMSKLTSVIIGNGVTSIGYEAFAYCSGLTSVTIGNSVTSIGDSAFKGCSGLTSVTIGNSVTSIGRSAFAWCSGLTSITIPESVTSIGYQAFHYCSGLTSITIPNSVTSIGGEAFSGCSGLTTVIIGNGVTSIGYDAFAYCSGLTSVTIPNSVTSIGQGAFFYCSGLTSVTIPNSVTSIEKSAFQGCSGLTAITIPDSVTSIGKVAFSGCSGLTSVTIPNSVTSIGASAFSSCSGLTSITIPNSVTSIEQGAFFYCSGLTSITIPDSVTSIGVDAFSGCSGLTSVTIGNSVTSIGGYAFYGCSGLTSITIPNSVTSIGESAFKGCTGLASITIECGTPPSFGYDCFESTSISKIYVPCGTLTAYKASSSTYANYFSYPETEYHLSLKANSNIFGSVNITSSPDYCANYEGTFSATPNYGYHFTQWSDGNTDNPRTITLTSDTTLTAEFAKNEYTLVTTVSDSLMGVTYGDTTALYLDTVLVSAKANYGYHFVRWSDGNTDNPRSITVTKDTTYTAEFAENERFTISVSAENGSVTGAGTYASGIEITLTATANNGYHFTQWSDGNTDNPRVLVLTQDTAFVAEFERNSYSVTTTPSDLAMGRTYGDTTALYQDSVTIWATPATGYQFNSWSDGNTDNPRTIMLTQDTSFVANFGTMMCTLVIVSNIDEAADITGSGTYAYGTDVTCFADVMTDYRFVKWGNGQTTNPYKFKIYEDMTLYAFFNESDVPLAPDSVVVSPGDNNANIQWPQVDNAQTYTMTITKDGEIICSLTFNGLGQLININFYTPNRGVASAALGFNFTVTGLQPGTTYGYTIEAKDEKGEVLSAEEGIFTTIGLTGLDAVNAGVDTPTKFLRDGQILIQRGDRLYDLRGQMVK